MIYLFLVLSLAANILLVWYVRKLLMKFWYDVEVRKEFTVMLKEYSESLKNLYGLEEFHGEESIKRAIKETNFVIEASQEFAKTLETEEDGKEKAPAFQEGGVYQARRQEEKDYTQGRQEDYDEDTEAGFDEEEGSPEESVIRLREGQKVSQEAGRYRRVVPTG
jgi:Mg-chelatase subunit ChlI